MNVGTRSFFPQVVHAKLLFSKLSIAGGVRWLRA